MSRTSGQYYIQAHVQVCNRCLGFEFCAQLKSVLLATTRNNSQQEYNNDDYYYHYYDEVYNDWRYCEYGYDEWYGDAIEFSSYLDYDNDAWHNYPVYDEEYLAAAEYLNFEHHAPKGRIHTYKHTKKDKRFYLKKKFAHLPMRKRFILRDPLISRKEIFQYSTVNAIELPQQKKSMKIAKED